jgi:putative membrane protein
MKGLLLTIKQVVIQAELSRPVLTLLGSWALVMIALPIVSAFASTEVFNMLVVVSVLIQAITVLVVVTEKWGWWRTFTMALIAAALSWLVEAVGSATGFPFGDYDYTPSLQPQLFGVPLVIPLAWLMMLPPAWAVAQTLVGLRPRWVFILVSAAAFTAWDLFLDPQMVSWGYWVWEDPTGYFGIPWVNYLGWFLTASLLTFILRPQQLPTLPLLVIYTITWALEAIGLLVFFGLPGPGLVGAIVMGSFVILAWRRVVFANQRSVVTLKPEHNA